MTFTKKASLLGLLAASLIGSAAQAEVVASSDPLGALYGGWSNVASSQNFLVQFTLGSDTTLTGFDIYTFRSFAAIGTGVSVKIRADDGSGLPAGSNLYQFNDVVDGETAIANNVDISSIHFDGPTLAAGTYWMGVSGLAGELSWASYANGGNGTLATQAQLAGDTFTRTPSIHSLAYRIEGEAANNVPEPASWALAAVALAGLGASRRRAAR